MLIIEKKKRKKMRDGREIFFGFEEQRRHFQRSHLFKHINRR
jgi:hypothetical protein